jgi:aryl-phospho-beta-D-glucosidase BglC (GH1 family)
VPPAAAPVWIDRNWGFARNAAMRAMSVLIILLPPLAVSGCFDDGSGGAEMLPPPPEEDPYPDYNTNPIGPDMTGMSSSATEISERIGLGLNIGNTLEAIGGETAWGNPPITRDFLDAVRANGFDAIRLPASWDQYADQETARIDSAWLDRVEEVVQYCVDNDLYVILNVHWDGGWLENHVTPAARDAVAGKQRAFWQQIATHMRDFDEHLLFASANEPNVETEQQMDVLQHYHQTFVDAVRRTGGRNAYRILVLQGPSTDIERTDALWLRTPEDTPMDRLMMEVHFYTPYNFTLMGEDQSWGNMFYYWGQGFHSATDPGRNATYGEEEDVAELLASMKRRFVDRGIPVVIGEYTAIRRDDLTGEALERHLASRGHYLEYVTRQSLDNGLLPFYWDTGGLIDRRDLTVLDADALEAIRRGAGK